MIRVTVSVIVPGTLETVWRNLADVLTTTLANPFHTSAQWIRNVEGVGGRLSVVHGWVYQREVRITHWEPGVRLSWIEFDRRWPRALFPHANHYALAPLPTTGAPRTRLTYALTGSVGIAGLQAPAESILARTVVPLTMHLEAAALARAGARYPGL